MAKKPTVTTLASGFNSTETLNSNFNNIADAFDNTLSLDGSTPNAMGADLDLNSNNIINATAIMVGGSDVVATTAAALAAAVQAQIDADAAVVASALSETNAANSATASQTSADASQASRLAAELAETNAETAETNAETAETNSETSATNSAASANAALGSQNAASSSAAAALASQVDANTSQGNASVSALAASNSETAAALSESNAATSATNAATSETNAASSETAASSSATAAAASETAAATSETNAATSETNAAASAVTATTGATTATAQAVIATDQATQAAADVASIQGAAGAAVDAANSAAAAAAALDNFDDRYLGPKSSEPTLDNDGDALVSGSLYFSTTSNAMQVYDGANWIAASASGVASMILYEYTATAGQTTFTGADDNNNSISFIQGNEIVVFNGIILDPSDYTSTSGVSIVLNVGAALNDLINVYAFKSFTVADTVSASTGGTFGGDVAVTGNIAVTGTVDGRDVAADGALAASALQPTGDGSGLTNLSSSALTGALPAISGAALTGLPAGYTDTDVATYLAGVGNVAVGGTVDGVDIAARDAILTSTTTTANAAMPIAGGTFTGDVTRGGTVISDGAISDTGTFTLDVTGNIILDADNSGSIHLKDNNVQYGSFYKSGNNFVQYNPISDGDIILQGLDGASTINALTLDISQAGRATFNEGIVAKTSTAGGFGLTLNTSSGDNMKINVNDTGSAGAADGTISVSDGDLILDVSGIIILDADTDGTIELKDAGAKYGVFYKSSSNLMLYNPISNGDIRFQGNDGGSVITALTLDMSAAGAATFNNSVTATSFSGDGSGLTGISADLSGGAGSSGILINSTGSNFPIGCLILGHNTDSVIGGQQCKNLKYGVQAALNTGYDKIRTYVGISGGGSASSLFITTGTWRALVSNRVNGDGEMLFQRIA